MYQSTLGIVLIKNMYHIISYMEIDYQGAELIGNKHTNTRLYLLVQITAINSNQLPYHNKVLLRVSFRMLLEILLMYL